MPSLNSTQNIKFTKKGVLGSVNIYYAPNNASLAIVGDINPKDVIALVEQTFGRIPPRPPSPSVPTTEPPYAGERRVEV